MTLRHKATLLLLGSTRTFLSALKDGAPSPQNRGGEILHHQDKVCRLRATIGVTAVHFWHIDRHVLGQLHEEVQLFAVGIPQQRQVTPLLHLISDFHHHRGRGLGRVLRIRDGV